MEHNETLAREEGQGLETGKEAYPQTFPILSPMPYLPNRQPTNKTSKWMPLSHLPISNKTLSLFFPQSQTHHNRVVAVWRVATEVM